MKQETIIKGLSQLGNLMTSFGRGESWQDFTTGVTKSEYDSFEKLIKKQKSYNGWFTESNVRQSLLALGTRLNEKELLDWTKDYKYSNNSKRIGIIMAGNIPLVGFHDFLCVIISGNIAVCKLSSDDQHLLPELTNFLIEFVPDLKSRIELSNGFIKNLDAIIATGSDNSMKYFEQYFGSIKHLFRSNRTSVCILTGEETEEEMERLGKDVFSYFGLGCRNVTHLILPVDYDIDKFFKGIYMFGDVINNNKYGNNYDYNKTVYLMNKSELLDNNFVLLRESEDLFSPIAMVNYHYYKNTSEIDEYLTINNNKIQAIIGRGYLPFGTAQSPALGEYADGIDTMRWLEE